jgi:HSP20 family molecular chaperone IbpA
MLTIDYPFWTYGVGTGISYETRMEDGVISIDVKLPGIPKENIQLSYLEDPYRFNIFVKGDVDRDIYLSNRIDIENTTAELELGVLKIRAPIKISRQTVEIR